MTRSADLERRRLALHAQIAAERDLLADEVGEIAVRLSGVDRLVSGVRSFVRSPAVVVIGVAMLALIGPGRVVRIVSRGVVALTAARRLVRLVR